MTKLAQNANDWWIDHRWVDAVVTGVLVGGHAIVVVRFGHADLLTWITAGDRRGVYSAFAIVVSLTGALSGVAVGQLSSAKGDRAVALKKQGGIELSRNWRSIYLGAFLAAVAALLSLALDSTAANASHVNAGVARWIFEIAFAFAVIKFLRLSALFQALIVTTVLDDADGDKQPRVPAPRLDRQAYEQRRAG